MNRDTLFLLKGNFQDHGQTYYCPECAQLEGVLSFYPQLRTQLDVRYVDFQRPRPEIVGMIGEANQSCPVLVIGNDAPVIGEGFNVTQANGRQFIGGAQEIGNYLAKVYSVGKPH